MPSFHPQNIAVCASIFKKIVDHALHRLIYQKYKNDPEKRAFKSAGISLLEMIQKKSCLRHGSTKMSKKQLARYKILI